MIYLLLREVHFPSSNHQVTVWETENHVLPKLPNIDRFSSRQSRPLQHNMYFNYDTHVIHFRLLQWLKGKQKAESTPGESPPKTERKSEILWFMAWSKECRYCRCDVAEQPTFCSSDVTDFLKRKTSMRRCLISVASYFSIPAANDSPNSRRAHLQKWTTQFQQNFNKKFKKPSSWEMHSTIENMFALSLRVNLSVRERTAHRFMPVSISLNPSPLGELWWKF